MNAPMTKAAAIASCNVPALIGYLRSKLLANSHNIPVDLKLIKGWVCWRVTEINRETGKFNKIPIYPRTRRNRHGEQGSAEDLAELGTFDEAFDAMKADPSIAGVGIAMLPQFGLVALDVDHCVTDGVIRADVAEITEATYCEISPSGTGIRAFWKGDATNGKSIDGWELYHQTQFLTVTGNQVDNGWALVDGDRLPLLDAVTRAELEHRANATGGSGKSTTERLKDAAESDPKLTAIKNKGLYERDLGKGKHSITCPREDEHSDVGRSKGDGDTVYFQPNTEGYLEGFIHCSHTHDNNQSRYWQLVGYDDLANDFEDISGQFDSSNVTEKKPDEKLIPMIRITATEVSAARLCPRVILPNFLYADVRTRISAGGTGKTTLALYEAITLALGQDLWDRKPSRPCKTMIVTREDSREVLIARMREITKVKRLNADEVQMIYDNLMIVDLSGKPFRLSDVVNEVVVPHKLNLKMLIDSVAEWEPDWLIFDPLVSFGVGESRVNDAEQGLVEAFRILRNRLDCCVEGIHHSGKANARDKTTDQYSGRGGSALSDGCRMVAVMQPLTSAEWHKATGGYLEEGTSGIVLALPKLSYAPPQEPIFILRQGYQFLLADVRRDTPEASAKRQTDQVYEFIQQEFVLGRRYNSAEMDTKAPTLDLSRAEMRSAITELKVSGRIIYHGTAGKSGSHYQPVVPPVGAATPHEN